MAIGKIEFAIGSLKFSGEGEEKWLAEQLDKILSSAPSLDTKETSTAGSSNGTGATNPNPDGPFTETLVSHLKARGGETKQNKRFLATADWLRRKGNTSLTTAAVTKALSDNHQKRLGNAAECLNQNVSKGFCEKQGNGFYITPDGLKDLGYQ